MSNEKAIVNNPQDLRSRMSSSGLIAPFDPTEPIESIEPEQSEIPTELDANLEERITELQTRINDLENLLKVIPELEKTIEGLENRTEDLENKPPLRGERGKPGDISAALHNVEQAAPGLVKTELKKLWPEILLDLRDAMPALVDDRLKRLQITELRGERGPVGETGRDGQSIKGNPGRDAAAPTKEFLENYCAVYVAREMAESQLLDESGEYAGPLLKFAIEQAVQQELLKIQR